MPAQTTIARAKARNGITAADSRQCRRRPDRHRGALSRRARRGDEPAPIKNRHRRRRERASLTRSSRSEYRVRMSGQEFQGAVERDRAMIDTLAPKTWA